ncbi:MAG: hypothetical protein JWN02_1224 [Acidobacteria bacterium]|nr:hypothetical protein [Acidobacteriota bacterium]
MLALSILLPGVAQAAKNKPKDADPRAWIDSPEAYFITPEERAQWNQSVLTNEEATAFINTYWQQHGAAFKENLRKRIEFADSHFGLADIPGSVTQRGRVWIILGSPNQEKFNNGAGGANSATLGSVSAGQGIEANAIVERTWIYKKDRLPKDLNVPELTVIFQTDVARAQENIQNPGLVEPFLTKAGAYFGRQQMVSASTRQESQSRPANVPGATTAAPAAAPVVIDDALFQTTENAAGTSFTGETYVSPTDQPFYAVSFYVPLAAPSFATAKNVTFVGLIKDAAGKPVTSVRESASLEPYDGAGDRYVDRAFQLAPGKYSGTFALLSADGKPLASRHLDFEVPEPTATRVSNVLLTSRIDTLESQKPFDPFTFVATKYAVKGDRKFHAGDKIGFFTAVSNPAGPDPSMTMRMTIYRDGKQIEKTPLEPVTPTQTGPHSYLIGTQFDANTFKPGHYLIEIQLRDMKADHATEAFTKGYARTVEFDVAP